MSIDDPKEDVGEIEIRPEVTMLSVLKHLNYEPWFAIAEFVDNALQSFAANQTLLKKLHGDDFCLTVDVTINTSGWGEIVVRDNAAGIFKADFPRAFRPAQVPANRSGLSEFGMGMKSAACWFAESWAVRTKALGESVERTIRFDVQHIVENKIETLQPELQEMASDAHHTIVTLRRLHQIPKGRTVGKIKEHLASIYRVFIRDGLLILRLNDEVLGHQLPKILNAIPYVGVGEPAVGPDVMPVEWSKQIDLDFGEGQRVTGFAALREKASTSLAGFALFRRGRLIEGSHDETYRPHQIFKHNNSYPFQRLFGELHIEGFEVSHTKDGFRWEEYEDEFLDLLKEAIEVGDLNLIAQAENFRSLPTKRNIEAQAVAATTNVATHLTTIVAPLLVDARLNPAEPDALSPEIVSNLLQASEKIIQINDGDYEWIITLRTTIDPAVEHWISVGKDEQLSETDSTKMRRLTIDLSLAHPFSTKYIGALNENIELFLRLASAVCISLVLSEDLTGEPPQTVLYHFNYLLRGALARNLKYGDINQNSQ
jgi:hypothetical protein